MIPLHIECIHPLLSTKQHRRPSTQHYLCRPLDNHPLIRGLLGGDQVSHGANRCRPSWPPQPSRTVQPLSTMCSLALGVAVKHAAQSNCAAVTAVPFKASPAQSGGGYPKGAVKHAPSTAANEKGPAEAPSWQCCQTFIAGTNLQHVLVHQPLDS
jgi:hypothetical protein